MPLSCEAIARKILGEAQHISAGEAYYTCPNHDDRHPSLKINFAKDKFLCGPCGAGGGPWSLAAFLARVGANEKKAVGAWLRENGFSEDRSKPEKQPKPERQDFSEVAAFYYTPVLRNVRFEAPSKEGPKPEKTFQWQHLEKDKWVPGGGGMTKPLYANKIFREADNLDLVLGFEGEAKCELAGKFGLAGFSYKYLTKEECVKLADLDVVLWPDADQPGIKQAKVAAELVNQSKQARSIRICTPPLELPVSGDIVDAVSLLQWGEVEIRKLIAGAAKYPPEPKPIGVWLSTVQSERAEWLWKNRIPTGVLAVLDGDPGVGKSTLALELAARISRGQSLPDNGQPRSPACVIVLSAEDSPTVTIKPRLEAAGADLSKVMVIPNFSEDPSIRCVARFPRDLKVIQDALASQPFALVIVDLLSAYVPTEFSLHNDQDVRNVLAPMSSLANKTGTSFLLLRHLNKNQGASAMYRGGGSIGITGAGRAVLLLARDQTTPDLRVLAVIKSTMAPTPPAVSFRLGTTADGISRVEWQGLNNETADSLLAAAATVTPKDREEQTAVAKAREWLLEQLAEGAVQVDKIRADAKENFISAMCLRRAADSMDLHRFRMGFGGPFLWELRKSKERWFAQKP